MSSKLIVERKIKEMRRMVAEAYMAEHLDYEKVLKLSIALDRLILLDMKVCKSHRKAG